jgi:stress-induced morphogen
MEEDTQRMIARHRLVNDSLKDEFAAGLHALSIKAKSPEEYEAAGGGI